MALVLADLVQETTSTTGTGTLTLTGPVPGYQSFAAIGTGNTTMYRIKSGEDSEVGLGTYNGTLIRDTVYMSIIAGVTGTTKIDVAAGATVICTYPAEKAVAFDDTGLLTLPDASALKWTSDLTLYRDAANTLAQRNATTSQVQRLYNTYSDASNYARASLSFVTYSGALYTKLAAESAGTGAANIGIALSPKGTGAITAQVPDGTTTGGNARGAGAVDLQMTRDVATKVASGANSILMGQLSSATGDNSIALGTFCSSASNYCFTTGYQSSASNQNGICFGSQGNAYIGNQFTVGGGRFLTNGDAQYSTIIQKVATTDATLTTITNRYDIPASTTWAVEVDIVARSTSGAENGYYKRRLMIKKGTTNASVDFIPTGSSTLGQIIGTDIGTTNLTTYNPISFQTNTANGSLAIYVTGLAATNIRWVAKVSLVEVGYA